MNKKGDISITILVLGVVAICFLTILSFMNGSVESSFVGVGLIETINSIDEEIKNGINNEDYNDKFEKGNVKIENINSNKITGTYIKKDKVIVKVTYTKK